MKRLIQITDSDLEDMPIGNPASGIDNTQRALEDNLGVNPTEAEENATRVSRLAHSTGSSESFHARRDEGALETMKAEDEAQKAKNAELGVESVPDESPWKKLTQDMGNPEQGLHEGFKSVFR